MTSTENIYNSTSAPSLVRLLRLIYDSGIFGVNGVIAMNSTDTGHESFLTDGRGSVTEMITGSGNITTYSYDAFGNVRTSGDSANPFTYNQERFDFGVGLQYLRARYVDLSLGRFVSRDSVLGTLEDPRTHNLFLYVQNDPMNFIDPSGHIAQAGGGASICNTCNNGQRVPVGLTRCNRCNRTRRPCTRCNDGRRLGSGWFVCQTCNRTATGRPQLPARDPINQALPFTPRPRPRPNPPQTGPQDWVNRARMAQYREYIQNSNALPASRSEVMPDRSWWFNCASVDLMAITRFGGNYPENPWPDYMLMTSGGEVLGNWMLYGSSGNRIRVTLSIATNPDNRTTMIVRYSSLPTRGHQIAVPWPMPFEYAISWQLRGRSPHTFQRGSRLAPTANSRQIFEANWNQTDASREEASVSLSFLGTYRSARDEVIRVRIPPRR